jgi:NADH-quinone oxidoreductase subunit J
VIAFWIAGVISVIAALGLVFVRKAVYGALFLATVMICLAVLYITLDAPFLAVVQVIVYTGAVMMLFLFVLMLVGVDSSDSLVETIKGQRILAVPLAVVFGALLVTAIGRATLPTPKGLAAANANGNVQGLAVLIFSRYVLGVEVVSGVLIVAALGATVLAHKERVGEKVSQVAQVRDRMARYAADGLHPGSLPPSGTFARHNAVDTPALLPDGRTAPGSVSRLLVARGNVLPVPETADDVEHRSATLHGAALASTLLSHTEARAGGQPVGGDAGSAAAVEDQPASSSGHQQDPSFGEGSTSSGTDDMADPRAISGSGLLR